MSQIQLQHLAINFTVPSYSGRALQFWSQELLVEDATDVDSDFDDDYDVFDVDNGVNDDDDGADDEDSYPSWYYEFYPKR